MLCLYVCVRGACAVRVAGDELLPFSAFVVHRVAHCAGRCREDDRRQKIDSICRHHIEVVRVRAALRAQKVRKIFA